MGIFLLILMLLILLILIMIIGSTMQFSILICTKQKIEFEQTILPSFLALVSFCIVIFATNLILLNFNIDIINLIYMFILNLDFNFNQLVYGLFAHMGSLIIYSLIQAFCIKLVYIDYAKIFKNLFKKKTKEFPENSLCEITVHSISFFNSYLAGLLSLAFLFFIFILFVFLGTVLAGKII